VVREGRRWLVRAWYQVPKPFLHCMLHQDRDELRHPRTLISACLAKNLIMDGPGVGTVRVFPGELVRHPGKVLLEDLAAEFLTDRHRPHPCLTRLLSRWARPGTDRLDAASRVRSQARCLAYVHLNFIKSPDEWRKMR
jgi:hypothetical protein